MTSRKQLENKIHGTRKQNRSQHGEVSEATSNKVNLNICINDQLGEENSEQRQNKNALFCCFASKLHVASVSLNWSRGDSGKVCTFVRASKRILRHKNGFIPCRSVMFADVNIGQPAAKFAHDIRILAWNTISLCRCGSRGFLWRAEIRQPLPLIWAIRRKPV